MDLKVIAVAGLITFASFIGYGFFLKWTEGLFWSLFFSLLFINNRQQEQKIVQQISQQIWKFAPPAFIAFLILTVIAFW